MLIDGRLIPHGGSLRAEVAIAGAGPAGITVAELLAARGVDVVLLEAGGREHGAEGDDALRGGGTGRPFPLVGSRRRGFGGTSLHWTPGTGLRIRPLDAIDFDDSPSRPGSAWPFGRDELARHYARAHELIGMSDCYDRERWGLDEAWTPLAWEGGLELALFQFAPHDCFVRRLDALSSSRNLDVALHSSVRTIHLTDDQSAVSRLDVVSPGGNAFHVEAQVFVIAAGGIDNARVLLASPGRTGAGVGNEHDNVGRYFMDHLSVDSGIICPAPGIELDASAFGDQRKGDERFQTMLWLGPDAIASQGALSAAFWVNPLDQAYASPGVGAARKLRAAWAGTPRVGLATNALATLRGAPDLARLAWRRRSPRPSGTRDLALRAMTEQAPHRESRITLGSSVDGLGMPRVSLDWRVSDEDLAAVRWHQDALAAALERHGLGTVVERFEPDAHASPVMSNFHHMGATRMHANDRLGVVDADSRVHGAANLFVTGSSVFPSGGYLNPTLTIIALACRLAEHIDAEIKSRPAAAASPH